LKTGTDFQSKKSEPSECTCISKEKQWRYYLNSCTKQPWTISNTISNSRWLAAFKYL